MANVKISDLTQATALQETDLLIIAQDNGITYDSRSLPASLLESAGKKVFISKIKQLGVVEPILDIIQDGFNDTYTTNYVGVGEYEIVGFNNELSYACEITLNTVVLNPLYKVRMYFSTGDTLTIKTYDATNTLANNILNTDDIFLKVIKYL